MLLCPAQTHTSPAITLLRLTAPSPSSKLRPSLRPSALGDFTVSCQRPRPSAQASTLASVHDAATFTAAPGLAQPHRRTSVSCCITMLSPSTCGNLTFAPAQANTTDIAEKIKNRLCISS